MKTFYATTPIYYVNDLPHIGHIYSTVVTDVITRFHRLIGEKTWFLTGTDEHGQNIEKAAAAQGVTPIALADRVVERYRELYRTFEIANDDFIRTTEARHRRGVEALIARIAAAEDFYTAKHEGWYCSSCEAFYTEKELDAEKRCPVHGKATTWESEENVFFRLSKYAAPLLAHYEKHPEFVQPESRLAEVVSFVKSGLNDLSVSRSKVKWGIPFPNRPGHVVYVWLDALANYITALGFGSEDDRRYREFWDHPGAERVHVIGKDILRFHAVYWPAFLMSAGLPLPTTVRAHGWWLRDSKKVSKSVGNIVRPDHLVADFGPDALRYFLMREMAFGQDASFSDEAFLTRYNADLANDLGNTVSRVAALCRQSFGKTPNEVCTDNDVMRRLGRGEGRVAGRHDRLPVQPGSRGRLEVPRRDQFLRRDEGAVEDPESRRGRFRPPPPRALGGRRRRAPFGRHALALPSEDQPEDFRGLRHGGPRPVRRRPRLGEAPRLAADARDAGALPARGRRGILQGEGRDDDQHRSGRGAGRSRPR